MTWPELRSGAYCSFYCSIHIDQLGLCRQGKIITAALRFRKLFQTKEEWTKECEVWNGDTITVGTRTYTPEYLYCTFIYLNIHVYIHINKGTFTCTSYIPVVPSTFPKKAFHLLSCRPVLSWVLRVHRRRPGYRGWKNWGIELPAAFAGNAKCNSCKTSVS